LPGAERPTKQHLDLVLLRHVQDEGQVLAARRRVDPAQEVIAPQRHDHRVDRAVKAPFHPRGTACCGVARHARVHHTRIDTPLGQPGAQLRHEAFLLDQPIALGQAVAQREDIHPFRRRHAGQQHQRQHRRLAARAKGPI